MPLPCVPFRLTMGEWLSVVALMARGIDRSDPVSIENMQQIGAGEKLVLQIMNMMKTMNTKSVTR